MKKNVMLLISLLLLFFVLTSCNREDNSNNGDTYTISVTAVTLAPTSATLTVGDTLLLSATVLPAAAANKIVTWSSSNDLR